MKLLILGLLALSLSGCGYVNRVSSNITGKGYAECVDGVQYLQFVSGATVKYNKDGSIATCEE